MTKQVSIGILAYPGVMNSALYGLQEIFLIANRIRADHPSASWPELVVTLWGTDHKGGDTSLSMKPLQRNSKALDVLVIPPRIVGDAFEGEITEISAWLCWLREKGCVLTSACAGSLLLASAGILDGRRATTHWGLADEMTARYPKVEICPAELIIDENDLITAGGMMAWTDLALRIVERFVGPHLAMQVSKYFLIDTGQRDQRFYQSFIPKMNHGDKSVLTIQQWLQSHFQENISVHEVASIHSLTERTLQRKFVKVTGFSPSQYITQLRLQRARELLETSKTPVEEIVWQIGYEDQSSFNKLFKAQVGLTPGQYRRRFQI